MTQHDESVDPTGSRKPKVAITVEPQVKKFVDHLVETGEAASVSAAFNAAMLEKMHKQRRVRTLWQQKVAQADKARVARMMAHVESQRDQ